MAYTRKGGHEKLHNGKADKIVVTGRTFADIPQGAAMYIANPEVINEFIRQIPKGTQTTLQQMRTDLAARHGVDYCCPLTSGIFLRIVAEAAYEDYINGMDLKKITPFWRIISAAAPVCKKLSFGSDFIKTQRKKEGLPL